MLFNLKEHLKPHIKVKNINQINFEYLKSNLGIKYIIFDKDDTLTYHNQSFLATEIKNTTIAKISDIFK